MSKNNFNLNKISLFLIVILPIGLLIGTLISEIIQTLIIIIFFIKCFYEKKFNWIKNKYFLLLFIIWIILLLNLLFSQNYTLSFSRNVFFFKNIIFLFALSIFLDKKKNFDFILTTYLIITTVVVFDIFFETFYGKNILGFQSYDPNRIASFLKSELKIGHFMLGFSFISIAHYLERYSRKSTYFRILGFFLIIIFFISLLLTGERANILRGIFIAFMFILLSKKSVITHKKIFLILILLLTVSTYFFSEKIRYKFNVVFQPIKNFGIIEAFKHTQHSAHYYTAIKIYENYPFFGSGNKTYREECLKDKYKNDNYLRTAERCASHPHQIYFELLSEHGSVGTITIISIIFFILLKSFKAYLKSKNSVHLASILFIISQFLPIIPSGSFFTSWGATIFWINFAILLFYSNKICTK